MTLAILAEAVSTGSPFYLVALDYTFLFLHTGLIFFNLLGWAWIKTRRLNLLSIVLTVSAWFVFAPWYGLGYCPCTDWHWQVKRALGQYDMPNNYMTYLTDAWTGIAITDDFAARLAWTTLLPALILSVALNLRDFLRKRAERKETSSS